MIKDFQARIYKSGMDCAMEDSQEIAPRKQSQTGGRAAVCFCLNYIVGVKLFRVFCEAEIVNVARKRQILLRN